MTQTGIFKGRVLIPYSYGRFGYTRGGGKTWHGGIDLVGADDTTIYMPYYTAADGTQKPIQGTVTRARIVTDHSNKTWEWGYYVCVQLDADQTPDTINFLYFCHCEKLLVQAGQKVISGQPLAVMGNSGNAALNEPPYKHCHFEARATATGRGLDPTAYAGVPNAVGEYGSADEDKPQLQIMTIGPVSSGDALTLMWLCDQLQLTDQGLYRSAWADKPAGTQTLTIGPVSSGDAWRIMRQCQALGLTDKGLYRSQYVEG